MLLTQLTEDQQLSEKNHDRSYEVQNLRHQMPFCAHRIAYM